MLSNMLNDLAEAMKALDEKMATLQCLNRPVPERLPLLSSHRSSLHWLSTSSSPRSFGWQTFLGFRWCIWKFCPEKWGKIWDQLFQRLVLSPLHLQTGHTQVVTLDVEALLWYLVHYACCDASAKESWIFSFCRSIKDTSLVYCLVADQAWCEWDLSHLMPKDSKTPGEPRIVVLLSRVEPCMHASNMVLTKEKYHWMKSARPVSLTSIASRGQSQLRAGFSIETMQSSSKQICNKTMALE